MTTYFQYLYSIMSERQISKVTGIARSTLYDYKKGFYKPPAIRLTKFKVSYGKAVYQQLRSSGASIITAKRYQYTPPTNIDRLIIRHVRKAEDLAKRYSMDPEDILYSFGQSDKLIGEIEDS